MIFIKCRIHFSDYTSSKFFDYSDRHERTLIDYCKTIEDKIDAKSRLSLDEFLTYCCYFIAQKIRSNQSVQHIEDSLKISFIKLADIVPLKGVKTVQFDASIDDKQTRCVVVENPDSLEYV